MDATYRTSTTFSASRLNCRCMPLAPGRRATMTYAAQHIRTNRGCPAPALPPAGLPPHHRRRPQGQGPRIRQRHLDALHPAHAAPSLLRHSGQERQARRLGGHQNRQRQYRRNPQSSTNQNGAPPTADYSTFDKSNYPWSEHHSSSTTPPTASIAVKALV